MGDPSHLERLERVCAAAAPLELIVQELFLSHVDRIRDAEVYCIGAGFSSPALRALKNEWLHDVPDEALRRIHDPYPDFEGHVSLAYIFAASWDEANAFVVANKSKAEGRRCMVREVIYSDIHGVRLPGIPLNGAASPVPGSRSGRAMPIASLPEAAPLPSQTESAYQVRIDGRLRYLPPEGPVGLPTVDQNSQILTDQMRRPMTTKYPDLQVSIVSFNMLLKGFDGKFYYPSVAPELRAWPWRKEKLQRLLFGLDADIYCMQEVECITFSEEMTPWLLEGGYASVDPKDDSKGKYPEMAKTAIFYKQARLQKIWEDHRSRIVLAAFRHLASGRVLYVASCHLEGAPWQAATRFVQCRKALESIARHQKTLAVDPSTCALVFAGDFNETDDGAVCRCLGTGSLQKDFRVPSLPDVEITTTDFTHAFGLSDLYSRDATQEPQRPATFCAPPEDSAAWGNTTSFAAVDFVYYSHRVLRPIAIRQPFSPEQFEATVGVGIPSAWHFSDHVPIGGIFEFGGDAAECTNGANAEII